VRWKTTNLRKQIVDLDSKLILKLGYMKMYLLPAAQVQEVPLADVYFKEDKADKDAQLWITDNAASGALKKLTRAFCEEGNVENNPTLALAVELCIKRKGSLTVKRSAEVSSVVSISTCVYVCMYVCRYVCMYVRIYLSIDLSI
jgi:hypothetical protein